MEMCSSYSASAPVPPTSRANANAIASHFFIFASSQFVFMLFFLTQRGFPVRLLSCPCIAYIFTAPMRIPLAKYFCKNGYTTMMGNIVMITAAIFNPWENTS